MSTNRKILPISEDRHCPNCKGVMGARTTDGTWSCLGEDETCKLISCQFDKEGKNPRNLKWAGVSPLRDFGIDSTYKPRKKSRGNGGSWKNDDDGVILQGYINPRDVNIMLTNNRWLNEQKT